MSRCFFCLCPVIVIPSFQHRCFCCVRRSNRNHYQVVAPRLYRSTSRWSCVCKLSRPSVNGFLFLLAYHHEVCDLTYNFNSFQQCNTPGLIKVFSNYVGTVINFSVMLELCSKYFSMKNADIVCFWVVNSYYFVDETMAMFCASALADSKLSPSFCHSLSS